MSFEVISGKLICSDPCYEVPTWCQGVVENVKKGTWEADVEADNMGDWGDRICKLNISHKGSSLRGTWEELNFTGGVDSGQFGFFDIEFYRNDESAIDLPKYDFGSNFIKDEEKGEEWYRACCQITLNSEQWGELPNGVVSSSGFGDGSYPVFGMKDENGEYIAFSVVFIADDEEDDEDDWSDWNDEEEE